jgi:hypothetical protein
MAANHLRMLLAELEGIEESNLNQTVKVQLQWEKAIRIQNIHDISCNDIIKSENV